MSCSETLITRGMSRAEARRKSELFAECEKRLNASEIARWWVPGRIEVLGKHTDYAGGRSLLCTVERGMCIAAAPRADGVVQITDCVRNESLRLSMSRDLPANSQGWSVYPTAVVRRITANFPGSFVGADIVMASDLPRASGMSSSSVLVTGVFTVLSAFNQLECHPNHQTNIRSLADLAGYLGCIENGENFRSLAGDAGVGTFGGSEDHIAILCSSPGELVQYSFCPARFEAQVPLPKECMFVIASSGVRAPKTGSARERYNNVSRRARAILALWRSHSGQSHRSLAEAVTSSPDAIEEIRAAIRKVTGGEFPSDDLLFRFEQFLLESQRVIPEAVNALENGDLARFGALVDESQAAAERGLNNQTPETIALARDARRLGAHAASAFGAGFGGSVWALIDRNDAQNFCQAWRELYLSRYPALEQHCQFFLTNAGPPLTRIS